MKIRDYFKQPGSMSKSDMARRLGKSKGYITALCNEEYAPHSPTALAIVELTEEQVTLEDLVPNDKRVVVSKPIELVVGCGELVEAG